VTPVTGTATVVLGDVAGSSRMWQQQPDAMASASKRLHNVLDDLAETHHGHRPREQGEGDNLVAVFSVAADAAAFALAMDGALVAEPWPGDLDVRMRIGLHTGDVIWDANAGYLGPTFNRAARIRDLGHGGMILCSQATHDIVADSLPAGAEVRDLGQHQLRDLSASEHVLQVVRDGDDTDWPDLKSVSARPNNLPIPVTSLVGRDAEIADVAELLRERRLVTLTGAGGSGKTRLAQHVASRVLSYAPDGAWWIDLMPVAEDDRIPIAIAEAAGLSEVINAVSLAAAIGDRKMLLVIDNCEHLIDAVADTVEVLLGVCREVRIIATSRETLDVTGEHAVRVRPLRVPEQGGIRAVADLHTMDSTRLFVERAEASGLFQPDDQDAAHIGEICRRLDGIPLAIELAAARTRLLAVSEIAAGLDDRFTLLGSTGRRRRSSRQRTLEASVAWSFDLLDEHEQAMLCRLGVFPGPFDLDGAASVGATPHALDILSSLVDKSLITVRPDPYGRRYRLLETIRQYALDRLSERGEAEAARDAHLEHMVQVCEGLAVQIPERAGSRRGLDDLDVWADDVRAAEQWAWHRGRGADVAVLRFAFMGSAMFLGRSREWLAAITPVLEEPDLPQLARARALATASICRFATGDPAQGLQQARASLEAFEGLDHFDRGSALWGVALNGPYVDGSGAEEALELWAMIDGEPWGATFAWGVCSALLNAERWEEAHAVAVTGRRLAQQAKMPELEAMSTMFLCITTHNTARGMGADEALAAWELMVQHLPLQLGVLAASTGFWPLLGAGKREELRALVADAERVVSRPFSVSWIFAGLAAGQLAIVEGDAAGAIARLQPVVDALRLTSMRYWLVCALAALAAARATDDDVPGAEGLLDEARGLLPAGPAWVYPAGLIAWAAGPIGKADPGAGLELLHWFLDRGRGGDSVGGWLTTHLGAAAQLCLATGRTHEAATLTGACLDRVQRTGSPPSLAELWLGDCVEALEATLGPQAQQLFDAGASLTNEAAADLLAAVVGHAPTPTERPVTGWGALTPAEVDVARKVAEGLTNAEVADALFVSTNTVKTHLKNIYAKLDISSRASLATTVTEQPA
jgi:predicted ATPase/class 3 adenylate cyclase/DNA-binding CsgD family transcriptional regulator